MSERPDEEGKGGLWGCRCFLLSLRGKKNPKTKTKPLLLFTSPHFVALKWLKAEGDSRPPNSPLVLKVSHYTPKWQKKKGSRELQPLGLRNPAEAAAEGFESTRCAAAAKPCGVGAAGSCLAALRAGTPRARPFKRLNPRRRAKTQCRGSHPGWAALRANSLRRAFRHRLRKSVRSANKAQRPRPKRGLSRRCFGLRGGEEEKQRLEQGVEHLAMETGAVRFI